MLKHQLLEFYVTGVDDIMVVKFDHKIRIVIGAICCFEIYSNESLDNDGKAPKIQFVTAAEIDAED